MKISEIIAFRDALFMAKPLPLPAPLPWGISRNIQKFTPLFTAIDDQVKALVVDNAAEGEVPWMPGRAFPKFADQAKADSAWREFMETEDTLEGVYVVDATVFEKADGLSAALLEALAPMVRE